MASVFVTNASKSLHSFLSQESFPSAVREWSPRAIWLFIMPMVLRMRKDVLDICLKGLSVPTALVQYCLLDHTRRFINSYFHLSRTRKKGCFAGGPQCSSLVYVLRLLPIRRFQCHLDMDCPWVVLLPTLM